MVTRSILELRFAHGRHDVVLTVEATATHTPGEPQDAPDGFLLYEQGRLGADILDLVRSHYTLASTVARVEAVP